MKTVPIITVLCLCGLLGGEVAGRASNAQAAVVGRSDEDVKQAVDSMLDGALDGLANGDHILYVQYFSPALRESVSAERFAAIKDKVRTTLGDYLYRDYLGFINKGGQTTILWRAAFERTQEDMLIKMTAQREGSAVVITGLTFE